MSAASRPDQGIDFSYADYEFVAEFYDHVLPYRDRPDIRFYREQALINGGPVLELGCGTGRVLIPIARSGIQITGVDLSDHMLSVCRQRLQEEDGQVRSNVELIEGDMRTVEVGARFNLVTSPFRAFQHLLTVEAQIRTIRNAFSHLQPGGHFILDVFNPSLNALTDDNHGEQFGQEPEFVLPDGSRVVRSHRIVERDLIDQISSVELIYNVADPDGHQERLVHAFKMRHLFRFELEHLVARCGFEVEEVYGDFDRKPYGAVYPGELIFIARKAGGAFSKGGVPDPDRG
ncbi:MAG: class I SAM-dependent methyltransferase [Anaerolineales bacterium]|nr:class I SAM-dependent methyltransferase [Anaerolineales bacterium]